MSGSSDNTEGRVRGHTYTVTVDGKEHAFVTRIPPEEMTEQAFEDMRRWVRKAQKDKK